MLLWSTLANELASWCCTSATMDIKTVHRRYENEGSSFLTITLTNFAKDLQKGLAQGYVDHNLFTGFRFRGGTPIFMGGFLDLVFDRDSGALLDDPSIDAIFAMRQLTMVYGKTLNPCSDARVKDAMDGYIKCEEDVRASDHRRTRTQVLDFRRVSDLLYGRALQIVDRQVYYLDLVPKHGPGATADRIRGNAKYEQSTWTRRLEEILPSGEFLLPNWSYYDQLEAVDILEPEAEIPVRVISVPKTLKTPRIIGIEPACMQYAQQALLRPILDALGRDILLAKMIGFDDQEPNQLLAKKGSLTRNLATLDLSEASDRVSNQLVRAMMHNYPHIAAAVDASRSRKADVPGHGVVRLAKFASMGSALTFPMEAMVFLTIIFLGIESELKVPLTRKLISQYSEQVRVYGDDIIVPVHFVRSVVSSLESFGFRVNTDKSFWTGGFRESCGKDFYDGHDVSVVRFRRDFPTHRRHAREVISLVSFRNQLYHRGLWKTCEWLDGRIREIIRYFPVVLPTSRVLGRHSYLGYESQGLDDKLHTPMVKGYTTKSVIPKSNLEGYGALLKFFIKRSDLPTADVKHLERAGRPDAVDIKLGKFSAV